MSHFVTDGLPSPGRDVWDRHSSARCLFLLPSCDSLWTQRRCTDRFRNHTPARDSACSDRLWLLYLVWCTCPRSLAPSPELFCLLQWGWDRKWILNTCSHHAETIVFKVPLNSVKDKQTFPCFRLVNVLGITYERVWSQTGQGRSRLY